MKFSATILKLDNAKLDKHENEPGKASDSCTVFAEDNLGKDLGTARCDRLVLARADRVVRSAKRSPIWKKDV